ncbi:hypothetical protein FZW96_11205 [Bacillus sp. BGMRC 2118]|nr:hypothetical protein FZW96_11205 [Bacillus sp. BGMRC 2118]
MMYGTENLEVHDAGYKIHRAHIIAALNEDNPHDRRKLIIAPQIPKMFWDKGLQNIRFYPYLPPEQFPPYKEDDLTYIDRRIKMYTDVTPENLIEFKIMLKGGLDKKEIKNCFSVLKQYWEERKL